MAVQECGFGELPGPFGKHGFILLFIMRGKSVRGVFWFSSCAHFIMKQSGGGGEEESKEVKLGSW